jgi:hypothetical protein
MSFRLRASSCTAMSGELVSLRTLLRDWPLVACSWPSSWPPLCCVLTACSAPGPHPRLVRQCLGNSFLYGRRCETGPWWRAPGRHHGPSVRRANGMFCTWTSFCTATSGEAYFPSDVAAKPATLAACSTASWPPQCCLLEACSDGRCLPHEPRDCTAAVEDRSPVTGRLNVFVFLLTRPKT